MHQYIRQHPHIYYLLMIFSCCTFSAAAIGISTNCLGLFMLPIAESMHTGIGSTTMIVTIMSLSSAFFAPILSRMFAAFPINRIMSGGVILNVLSLFLISLSHQLWMMYVCAGMLGIGNCCFALIPITSLLNHWFYEKNGLVSGLCISFSGVTAALASPLINQMIRQLGWRTSLWLCAIIIFLLAFPTACFIVRMHPSQVGLKPYGYQETIQQDTEKLHTDTTHSRSMFLTLILFAIIVSTVTSFNPNIASFAGSIGFDSRIGAVMVSSAMISNVCSKILLGILADRFNAKLANILMISLSACGLVLLSFVNVNSPSMAIAAAFLFGFIFSSNAAGIPLMIKEILGRENYARYYSILSVFTSVSYALGTTLIGFSYDAFHSYSYAAQTLSILAVISILFTIFMAVNQKKK